MRQREPQEGPLIMEALHAGVERTGDGNTAGHGVLGWSTVRHTGKSTAASARPVFHVGRDRIPLLWVTHSRQGRSGERAGDHRRAPLFGDGARHIPIRQRWSENVCRKRSYRRAIRLGPFRAAQTIRRVPRPSRTPSDICVDVCPLLTCSTDLAGLHTTRA